MSASNFSSEAIKKKQDSEGRQHGMEKGGWTVLICGGDMLSLWWGTVSNQTSVTGEPTRAQCDEVLKSLGVSSELSPNSLI